MEELTSEERTSEERLHYIVIRLQSGGTVKELAAELSLTRQRMYQLILKANILEKHPILRSCSRCAKPFLLVRPSQKLCSGTCKKPTLTHEERSARAKECHNRPEVREKMKQRGSDPRYRECLSLRAKERWESPEYRRKNKGRSKRSSAPCSVPASLSGSDRERVYQRSF